MCLTVLSSVFLWDLCTYIPYYFHPLLLFQTCKWSELVFPWCQWCDWFCFLVLKLRSSGLVLRLSVIVTAIYEHKRVLMKWIISTVNTLNKLKLCKVESKYLQSNCGIELPGWIYMEKTKDWQKWSTWSLLVVKQDGISCLLCQMNTPF